MKYSAPFLTISAWRRETRSAIPLSVPRSMSGCSPPSARPTIVRLCTSPKRDTLPLATSHAPAFACACAAGGEAPFWPAFFTLADHEPAPPAEDTDGLPEDTALLADEVLVPEGTFCARTFFAMASLREGAATGAASAIALALPL